MTECRVCGVALAPHELEFCQACWEATENDEAVAGSPPPTCDCDEFPYHGCPIHGDQGRLAGSPPPTGHEVIDRYYVAGSATPTQDDDDG